MKRLDNKANISKYEFSVINMLKKFHRAKKVQKPDSYLKVVASLLYTKYLVPSSIVKASTLFIWFYGRKSGAMANKVNSKPEVIKIFFCSAQLSMKFFLLINVIKKFSFYSGSYKPRKLFFLLLNVKMQTIIGIFTFMSRRNLLIVCILIFKSRKNSFLGLYEPE